MKRTSIASDGIGERYVLGQQLQGIAEVFGLCGPAQHGGIKLIALDGQAQCLHVNAQLMALTFATRFKALPVIIGIGLIALGFGLAVYIVIASIRDRQKVRPLTTDEDE